ncbi:pyrroloquinoline quinone biosynthesis peptide chaperone PqqD [Rubrobacter calidifluminis]|uniref:pyrroloquinoline quinone biosynthesis peptide chaperone PqqD n=1 Tax=Rubrobacter calidifluminis TaxID=1392640 RepID=UPI002361D14F|nr:pyrroloquinoline quinone biosynthesis peptide chaperone PqqD [Rubrobacter calidifluminis]
MDVQVLSTSRPRLARQARTQWDPVREKRVLLSPEGVLILNETGARIIELCDGERTVGEIVERLRERYERVVEEEVCDFIARLAARRLVEVKDG